MNAGNVHVFACGRPHPEHGEAAVCTRQRAHPGDHRSAATGRLLTWPDQPAPPAEFHPDPDAFTPGGYIDPGFVQSGTLPATVETGTAGCRYSQAVKVKIGLTASTLTWLALILAIVGAVVVALVAVIT